MPLWETHIYSYHPKTGAKATFEGPRIIAPSADLARQWCKANEKGYLYVTGFKVVEDIDDLGKRTNFNDHELN